MDPSPPPAHHGPSPRGAIALLAPATTALLLAGWGCSEPAPPAVSVGPVSYSEDQLLGISDGRRRTLADITALGLSVADSTSDELGAPLVREWVDDRRLEILAAELVLEQDGVGDEVLEAQYLVDPEWELTVRHILFFSERWRSPSHRAEAEAKAERALEALREGADFAATAAALSEEPGAEGRQGLLTPGREGAWVPEFWAAAVALEPGEISPVTETQYGYHILRLEDREVVPFDEARSVVARRVAERIGDPEAELEAWMEAAGTSSATPREAALAMADRRGIMVPEAERAELERRWDDMVYRWSATLGLRYGLSPTAVAQAALAALSSSSQGAEMVREELAGYRMLFDARYEVALDGVDA